MAIKMIEKISDTIKSAQRLRLRTLLSSVLCLLLLSACGSYNPNQSGSTTKLQQVLIDAKANADDLEYPNYDPSIIKGKDVYKNNCASCHAGPDGSPDRILTVALLRSKSPTEQYLTIVRGNSKGMPSFRHTLTRDQRWDVLMYVRSSVLGYFPLNSAELANMDKIFGANCAVCHGTRGDGDGPLHKSLQPPPADFNMFSRLYTRSDEKVFDEITNGIPWTAMPAWKDRYDYDLHYAFDDELRWKLVNYIRQFGFSQEVFRLDEGRQRIAEYKAKVAATAKTQSTSTTEVGGSH